jgi:hypothetical protein
MVARSQHDAARLHQRRRAEPGRSDDGEILRLKPKAGRIASAEQPLTLIAAEIDLADHAARSDGDERPRVGIPGDASPKERHTLWIDGQRTPVEADLERRVWSHGREAIQVQDERSIARAETCEPHGPERRFRDQACPRLGIEADHRAREFGELLLDEQSE